MVFGFSGAHRSGKTTLAQSVSEETGVRFHQTNTSAMLKSKGIDPVAVHDLESRLSLQTIILENHLQELGELPRPLIVDRTPADMYAYMAAEVTMHNSSAEFGELLEQYRKACLLHTAMHYDSIIVVQPLQHFQVDPTKPPPNRGYQWLIQYLIEGFLNSPEVDHVTRATIVTDDHPSRHKHSVDIIWSRFEDMNTHRKTLSVN
jgi:hypothetical protein